MQIKFLTALLLVGICFVQVILTHPLEIRFQSILFDDLISVAKQIIEKFQSIIKQKIDDAIKKFHKYKDQVNDLAQAAIEGAKKNMSEVVGSTQRRIDSIKQEAKKVGANISTCLIDNKDRFKKLYIKFLQDEVSCIAKEVDETTRIINGAIQVANDEWNFVKVLPKKLQDCGTGLFSLQCINEVIMDVTKLQVDLLGEIFQNVIEVSAFVSGLQNRVGICAVSQVTKARIEAARVVVAGVAKCVSRKTGKNIYGEL